MATIGDVAKKAGVSLTTVSRVLNDFSPVNEKTRARVLEAIEELNYSPSVFARGLRGQKTKSIAVLIPDFRSYWYSEVLHHIEREARNKGYLAIICTIEVDPERETEYINDLISRQVEGIILCVYKESDERKKFLKQVIKKTPFVIMDNPVPGLPVSTVYTDGYRGIYKITQAFIKQGHRKIAMLVNDLQYMVHQARFRGYTDAFRDNNIKIDESLVAEIDVGLAAGYGGAAELLGRDSPTAIVTMDDLTAVGVIRYCYENKISIPDHISVTGFDGIPPAVFSTPRLTTVVQDIPQLAAASIELLIKKIENKQARNQKIVFEPEIVLGETTSFTKDYLL
jgi:DNA-binding LacI/PurR family transcriptional regulator